MDDKKKQQSKNDKSKPYETKIKSNPKPLADIDDLIFKDEYIKKHSEK